MSLAVLLKVICSILSILECSQKYVGSGMLGGKPFGILDMAVIHRVQSHSDVCETVMLLACVGLP